MPIFVRRVLPAQRLIHPDAGFGPVRDQTAARQPAVPPTTAARPRLRVFATIQRVMPVQPEPPTMRQWPIQAHNTDGVVTDRIMARIQASVQ